MESSLQEQGVVVTGGASGLGAAVVRRLHRRGAVTIADLDAGPGRALAEELGEGASFVACDVRDGAQVEAAVAAGASAPAGLRAAVSCAGIGTVGGVLDENGAPHPQDSFETTLAVNLVGAFNLLRIAAAAMAGNVPDEGGERGVVILTSSLSGIEGAQQEIAYAASKGGVVGMVLPATRDLGAHGVRVNAIAPGSFETPMMSGLSAELKAGYAEAIPFPSRFGTPDEFAALVEHIALNRMLNGATLRIDGGARHH